MTKGYLQSYNSLLSFQYNHVQPNMSEHIQYFHHSKQIKLSHYFLNNSKTVIEKTNIKKGAAQRYIEDYITYDSDNI